MRKVLVIGAGGAGLAAAVQAAESGSEVTVTEREPSFGGNTANSTGIIRGSETWLQDELGIRDSYEDDFKEMWEISQGTCDPLLVSRLARNSASAYRWLRRHGVRFMTDRAPIPPRTGLVLPAGVGLTDALYEGAKNLNVRFVFETRTVDLLNEECKVTGARGVGSDREVLLSGFDATILCTGGVWGPRERLETYLPHAYEGLILSWGIPTGGKGDGLDMAVKAGAGVLDLDSLLTNCSVFLNENLERVGNTSSSLRHAGGALLINQNGERFANEDLTYNQLADRVAEELRGRGEKWVWEIWAGHCLEAVPIANRYPETYKDKGLLSSETLEGLAERMSISYPKLSGAVREYNSYFAKHLQRDPKFGRPLEHIHPLTSPPYFAFRVGIWCSSMMGGIRINTQAQVIDGEGNPIVGLFAAGDDSGGFYGRGYIPGQGLIKAIVFGRIAGENAAIGNLGAAERQETED